MGTTYLFYDIETSGTNPCFDQILQFAAIRTDEQLNELDRHQFFVRLNLDTVPDPGASITHRIALNTLQTGMSEYEAIKKIHALLNAPNTISVGYNTLGFDDEFLRFCFYRNLLPPYTHQYANGCGRMDIFPMTIMYFLYKKESLIWPEKNGKPSLKLELLNQINQLASGAAHDAICDVEATIALAKLLYKQKPMWDYLIDYFNKKEDDHRVQKLTTLTIGKSSYAQGLLIHGKFGTDAFFQAPVLLLGQHYHYKNQSLWLRLDNELCIDQDQVALLNSAWVINKKSGENKFILPMSKAQYLTPERLDLAQRNMQWFLSHPEKLADIADYYRDYKYPKVERLDVSAALYDTGFFSKEEERFSIDFHRSDWQGKVELAKRSIDQRMGQLALRIVGREDLDALPMDLAARFNDYLQFKQIDDEEQLTRDYRGKSRRTLKMALLMIDEVKAGRELDAEQLERLDELELYLKASVFHF